MAEITQAWLKANVGEPSGSFGSTYSSLYKKTGEYSSSSGPTQLVRMAELFTLLEKFSHSTHSGAKTTEQKADKDTQQRLLNDFNEELKIQRLRLNPGALVALRERIAKNSRNYPAELAIVKQVLEEMKLSALPLIANTGKGIEQDKIVMLLSDTGAGSMNSNGILTVNPLRAKNKSLLIGLLVHEYHHKLCTHNGDFSYADEFVAHWKEYSVIKPPQADAALRAAEINAQLSKLYPSHVAKWARLGFALFTSIDQVGDFAVADNAVKKQMARNTQSAARLAA